MQFFDHKDRMGASLVFLFSVFYLKNALLVPVDPLDAALGFTSQTLPIVFSVSAICVATMCLFISLLQSQADSLSSAFRHYEWKPMLGLVLLLMLYVATFSYLGFVLSSILFLQSGFILLGERCPLMIMSLSSGLVLFFWLMLTQVFNLQLDAGTLYWTLVD